MFISDWEGRLYTLVNPDSVLLSLGHSMNTDSIIMRLHKWMSNKQLQLVSTSLKWLYHWSLGGLLEAAWNHLKYMSRIIIFLTPGVHLLEGNYHWHFHKRMSPFPLGACSLHQLLILWTDTLALFSDWSISCFFHSMQASFLFLAHCQSLLARCKCKTLFISKNVNVIL